jgi:hypothetical protein
MAGDSAFCGESVKPSIDSILKRLVKVEARVVYHTSRGVGYLHVASTFPLAHLAERGDREFSPEALPIRWGGGTSSSTPGKEVCPETAEMV